MRKLLLVALFLLLDTAIAAAANQGVLVPIFYGDAGANGSLWRTRLTIFNHSDIPLPGIPIVLQCPIPEGCQQPIPAKSSVSLLATNGFRYPLGFFLFSGADTSDVWYSVRVFDESRSGTNYGTDVPVVPLSAFTSQPLQILDIPTDPAFRVTLRVYAIPPAAPRVRVAVVQDPSPTFGSQQNPPIPLKETSYDLAPSSDPSTVSFSRPSGAVIGDLLSGVRSAGQVRVEVQSTDGTPIWAFAAITNNATQFVSVAVPRSLP